MIAGRRWPLVLLILLALASPARTAEDEPASGPPLKNVDVVRMVMAGLADDTIIARIRSSSVDFDLAPDVVTELKRAGVSDRVVSEMTARAAASPAETASDRTSKPPEPTGWIEVTFDVDPALDPASNSVVAPAKVPAPSEEEGTGADVIAAPNHGDRNASLVPVRLSFVLICDVPSHVEDHWRTRSPLQRVGRHRLLMLEPSTRTVPGQDQFVYLELPASWKAKVPAGTHEGFVGASVRLGDRSDELPLALVHYGDLVVEAGKVTRMRLQIRSPGPKRRARRASVRSKLRARAVGAGDTQYLGDSRLRPRIKVLGISAPAEPETAAPPG